ncbi:MAG: Rne/Rng family ribonuclease [Desulfuromonadaceae bacterium]|nr:Rne/Rng family ribonuclease [Desulfuromonadaceae bacterium]MDD2848215.1 Rne/Rng family ribonuclease [Desulfuromonadaceae bacterium]MDD4130618.1 Rne/Rng family ribonuclease [Desulfuromonadaceae bacterium]
MSSPISKKMLINVMHPEETRVAIVHDGRLMELNIEISGKEQIKGNIYKGVVLRVEPGLQAAFVDIGRAKPGFLQIGELHPDYWEWRDDIPEEQRKRRPRIQEVLRRGQELVVQIEKDERDNKGSALTSYLSLPGRYMVIMPGSDSTGISRKVEQEGTRKKLKEIVGEMSIPEGMGYIIRTEAVGRSPEELQKDFTNLTELYESIKQRASETKGAGEIYRDSGLIIRTIRDYFSDDVDEVLVDSKDAYREAKEFFRDTMPACEKRVKLHKEKRPIFSRFQLEEQIDQIYEKRVALPSGGSLIIEPTEALVSIDVNSGKSSGERGIEDTAFKTNMEAAEEVARQLRLRDLGGLIVIDFIDMRENKHNSEVEKNLKNALKMDKARVNVGRISQFGIMEMSRQRIAKTLNDAIHLECPHCEGRGKVKSVEAMAVSFLRKVHAAAAKGTVAEVIGGLPLEVAYYLLNRKKRELTQIENDYEIEVTVKGKTSFLLNQLELETVKREKPHMDDVMKSEAEAEEAHKPVVPSSYAPQLTVDEEQKSDVAAPADGPKKRKRRKKKKKVAGEILTNTTELEQSGVTLDQDDDSLTEEAPETAGSDVTESEDAAEQAAKPKKRKRRRSRSKTHKELEPSGEDLPAELTPEPVKAVAEPAVAETGTTAPIVPETATTATEAKPKRTRSPRKKKAATSEEPTETQAGAIIAATPEAVPKEKKARRAAPKKSTTNESAAAESLPAAALEKPKPAKRPTAAKRPKKATENQ